MLKQFHLSKKADADLISFFLQQDERVASLVVAALCAYVKGERVNIPLHPVTIMEQDKRFNVVISFQENLSRKHNSPERQETIRLLTNFLNTIPDGMLAMYCKGILRYMYGHVIYQTEATKLQENTIPTYITPCSTTNLSPEKESLNNQPSELPVYEPASLNIPLEDEPDTDDDDDDDIFDLFESML